MRQRGHTEAAGNTRPVFCSGETVCCNHGTSDGRKQRRRRYGNKNAVPSIDASNPLCGSATKPASGTAEARDIASAIPALVISATSAFGNAQFAAIAPPRNRTTSAIRKLKGEQDISAQSAGDGDRNTGLRPIRSLSHPQNGPNSACPSGNQPRRGSPIPATHRISGHKVAVAAARQFTASTKTVNISGTRFWRS